MFYEPIRAASADDDELFSANTQSQRSIKNNSGFLDRSNASNWNRAGEKKKQEQDRKQKYKYNENSIATTIYLTV